MKAGGPTLSSRLTIALDVCSVAAGIAVVVLRGGKEWGEVALAAGLCAVGLINLWGLLVDRARVSSGRVVFFDKYGLRVELGRGGAEAHEPRRPARALGITKIAEDFDAPLPPDVQAGFES